jgi:pyridoxal phosphate enzyme (YggS family)
VSESTISSRLEQVNNRIAQAAEGSGRCASDVVLIAVSKTKPPAALTEALKAGAFHLGENRVQEAAEKKPKVPNEAIWHLIGPLQRNKVKVALETFDLLHTLDRPSLATRLQFLLNEHWPGRRFPVLLEVNVGEEPQKAGVMPPDAADLAQLVLRECPALRLDGLMAIPPFAEDPEAVRPHFATLRGLRDTLQDDLGIELPQLSMGMSHDFEVAIAEGATMVRVGTAVFGARG